jgi:cell fate regulator YaaT (PSP1 superfamily)
MGCIGCTVSSDNGAPKGCRSKGGCASGGCNRLNTFDWLSALDIADTDPFDIVEVSFKNGARKAFYRVPDYYRPHTGDMVVVETGAGFDVGRVTLAGELVRLQMRKKNVSPEQVLHSVVRKANERDLERLQEARDLEVATMIHARVIARSLNLEMKIGDVEYQGDKRKATFYYTADGRVDFRELIRHYAKEFRVKIEMRQIGARQESARIGGIGSCGRELCCSTWLTDFRSVSTAAARYQNLAINQAKLSGQCGRLKCCLNYELDTYAEAVDLFPNDAEKLQTANGVAVLVKTDIFRRLMYYSYEGENGRGKIYALEPQRVKEIKIMNDNGEKPAGLDSLQYENQEVLEPEEEMDYEDVTGAVELPDEKRRRKKKKTKRRDGENNNPTKEVASKASAESKPGESRGEQRNARSRRRPGNKKRK